jgi:creatinine deaminase
MSYASYLQIARDQAQAEKSDIKLTAAVLVKGEEVVAMSLDRRQQDNNPIATAEMECIRLAGRRTDQAALTLISTDYPDMLIAGTILQFSIGALVVGLPEISTPAIELLVSKGVPVTFCPDHERVR